MTDTKTVEKEVKDLPDLTKIESQDWFKTAYDAHTTAEYRTMLDEKGVGYHSSDNKTALTYRYLEATNGLQNDTQVKSVAEKPTEAETQKADVTTAQAPVSPTPVKDESEVKPAPATAEPKPAPKTENKAENKAETKAETISVKNNLGRDVLEPATGTRIIAGKTTKITPTAKATKAQILSNLTQLSRLNGNQLTFDE